jgi:hypothetical protein
MLFLHWAFRAASRAALTASNNNRISSEIIAITTSSSTNVKPVDGGWPCRERLLKRGSSGRIPHVTVNLT